MKIKKNNWGVCRAPMGSDSIDQLHLVIKNSFDFLSPPRCVGTSQQHTHLLKMAVPQSHYKAKGYV
jgi:hypothetical protein